MWIPRPQFVTPWLVTSRHKWSLGTGGSMMGEDLQVCVLFLACVYLAFSTMLSPHVSALTSSHLPKCESQTLGNSIPYCPFSSLVTPNWLFTEWAGRASVSPLPGGAEAVWEKLLFLMEGWLLFLRLRFLVRALVFQYNQEGVVICSLGPRNSFVLMFQLIWGVSNHLRESQEALPKRLPRRGFQ